MTNEFNQETEQLNGIEYGLDEVFPIFENIEGIPPQTLKEKGVASNVTIRIDNDLVITFEFGSHRMLWGRIKGQSLTPFDPSLGYQIDDRDFDPKRRMAKLREKNMTRFIGDSTPLPLSVVAYDDIHRSKYSRPYRTFSDSHHLALLRRLRLNLLIPDQDAHIGEYVGQPDRDYVENRPSKLHFTEFYPLEYGPLADVNIYLNYNLDIVDQDYLEREDDQFIKILGGIGLELVLPADPKALQSIRGKFFLEPEQ